MIKSVKVYYLVKINIDLIKNFPNLLTFYFINSMNFNANFLNWMRFCLLQGFYTPWEKACTKWQK